MVKKNLKHKYFEDYINAGDTFSLEIMDNVDVSKISKPTEKIDKSEDSNRELVLPSIQAKKLL
ncbi:hypothetical protein [Litoribacter populi]|uniref:hypothetical protein n=1 Tax=Litoribacter populi TaxID=2598460 RepID=UPI00117D2D9B|nr:hypothetical protein [Litoribacter populi]